MNKAWWLKLFFVATAMLVGIWVPLRVLYLDGANVLDTLLDLATLGLVAFHYYHNWQLARANGESYRPSRLLMLSDVLIALPLSDLLSPFPTVWTSKLLLLKVLILTRLLYIPKLLDAFDNLSPMVYRFVPLVIGMPMLVHLAASAWIGLGSGSSGPDPDHLTEYIRAMYWAVTTLTTVGYGDISAKTNLQMLLSCGVEVTGVAIFGYILSNVSAILARLDAAREHHLAEVDRMETYMHYNHLSPELRNRVRAYYKYIWESHRGYDDRDVLNTLPGKLHADIALELNQKIISQVPLLNGANEDVIQDIVMQLKPRVAVPGEKIFHIDEPGEAMFFIHSGEVEILSREGKRLATLHPGSFFGEMALLTNQGRNATARATTYCDLFVLSRSAFQDVSHRYPAFEKVVQETMASRLKSA